MKKEKKQYPQLPVWWLKKAAEQLAAALKEYRERVATEGSKAKAPEYLVTGELKNYLDSVLVICNEADRMAVDQQKEFGIRASEVNRAFVDSLISETTSGLAGAFAKMCMPIPEAYGPPPVEEGEEEETEEEETNE
jgi:hypothetical protein